MLVVSHGGVDTGAGQGDDAVGGQGRAKLLNVLLPLADLLEDLGIGGVQVHDAGDLKVDQGAIVPGDEGQIVLVDQLLDAGAQLDAALKAGQNGDKLCAGIQKLIDKYDLPFVTWNYGSLVHFEVSGVMYLNAADPEVFQKIGQRKKYIEEFGAALTANGVITLAGSRIYTSMADNDETIAKTLAAFEEVFSNVES